MDNLAARDETTLDSRELEVPPLERNVDQFKITVRDGYTVGRVRPRLDALLLLLKDCKGRQCTHPWGSYFPAGEVRNLKQALNPAYNAFFASLAKVDLEECTQGYIPEDEGPGWNESQVYTIVDEVWLESRS